MDLITNAENIMPRTFTQTQRSEMATRQNGLCGDKDCTNKIGTISGDFDAHHINPFSKGGETTPENGIALCKTCHQKWHDKGGILYETIRDYNTSHKHPLRAWQEEALTILHGKMQEGEPSAIVEACPGAGKSTLAGVFYKMAQQMTGNPDKTCVIMVAPTSEIQRGLKKTVCDVLGISDNDVADKISQGYGGDWHQHPIDYQGFVISYSSLSKTPKIIKNLGDPVEIVKHWKSLGFRFILIFDEIHHASLENKWGAKAEQLIEEAEFSLVMTGTPFRQDEFKIVGVKYVPEAGGDPDALFAQTDYRYTYFSGVKDGVVRPLTAEKVNCTGEIVGVDGSTMFKELNDIPPNQQSRVINKRLLTPGNDLFIKMVQVGWDNHLAQVKQFPDAAILFIIPSDSRVHNQTIEKTRQAIQELGMEKMGGRCEVISVNSKMTDAQLKLERFRGGPDPRQRATGDGLVAIRMVSEGVDIPRIMTICFLTTVQSDLLFYQIAGRATRLRVPGETGILVIPDIYRMENWAKKMEADSFAAKNCPPCGACGFRPCQCEAKCQVCEESPCKCERCTGCGYKKGNCRCHEDLVHVLDAEATVSGAAIAHCEKSVDARFVQIARRQELANGATPGTNAHQVARSIELYHLSLPANTPLPAVDDMEHVEVKRIAHYQKVIAMIGEVWRLDPIKGSNLEESILREHNLGSHKTLKEASPFISNSLMVRIHEATKAQHRKAVNNSI